VTPRHEQGRPKFFRLPTSRRRLRGDIERELRFHFEGRVDELIAQGYTRADAEREVTERFGDMRNVQDECEEIDTMTHRRRELSEWRGALARDVLYAVRGILQRPAFAAVVILTLGLGIGATTAIFALLDAVVLRPLAYPNESRLVYIDHPVPGVEAKARWRMSQAGYFFFRRNSESLRDIALFNKSEVSLVTPDGAERVRAALISDNFLSVVGDRMLLGREFTAADNLPNSAPVAVLGYDFWRQRFAGDREILGKTMNIASRPVEIVGVMRPGVQLPDYRVQVWMPLELDPNAPAVNAHYLDAVARLGPGVTLAAAQAEASRLTSRLPEEFPRAYSPGFMSSSQFSVMVTPLRDLVIGGMGRTLWILLGAVGIVLLIACANIANLFLVRAEARRREVAVRTALGADRMQLAAHYLAESIVLSVLGGVLAVGLAFAAVRFLVLLDPASVPRLAELSLGWRPLLVAFVLAVMAGVAFGLIPLMRVSSNADVEILRGGRGQSASRRQLGARSVLVVVQMALAVVLLAAAGLMLRSFQRLRSVSPGFDPDGVLTFEVSLPWSRYGAKEPGPNGYLPTFRFHRELAERLSSLPGVTGVSMTRSLMMKDGEGCALVFAKDKDYTRETAPCPGNVLAGPGYFETLGVPVRGRTVTWSDMEEKNGSVVISKGLADHLWPGEDPVGKRLRPNGPGEPWYHVVGVTGELHAKGLDQPSSEAIYYPMMPMEGAPLWSPPTFATYVLRTRAGDPLSLVPAARRIVAEMDREVPLANPQTMNAIVAHSAARTTFAMLLLAIAGGMALVLSAVGIYGVISYTVNQRRAEIGVRMALGAPATRVGRMIVGQSLRVAAVGIGIGLVGALATTRVMQSLLFNVSPNDPLTLGGVTILLVLLGAVSSYAPARRATKVDPVEVLRRE
jgi:predicted permease